VAQAEVLPLCGMLNLYLVQQQAMSLQRPHDLAENPFPRVVRIIQYMTDCRLAGSEPVLG
jgi:hypothetical protein